jgi:hypothetical protein
MSGQAFTPPTAANFDFEANITAKFGERAAPNPTPSIPQPGARPVAPLYRRLPTMEENRETIEELERQLVQSKECRKKEKERVDELMELHKQNDVCRMQGTDQECC